MTVLILVATLVAQAAAPAQAPAPAPAAAPDQASPAAAAPPAADQGFTYNPEGRRDPFVSLLRSGTDARTARTAGLDGVAGLAVDDISVRGIVAARSGYIAMVQGPDNKTYLVRQDDKLLDGSVKTITPRGMVILQEVSDPLSLVKQKEVRKLLRGIEEGK